MPGSCAHAFDADGDLDVVLGGSAGGGRVLRNDGALTFSEVAFPSTASDVSAIALGDVDGDGDLDVWLGSYNGRNELFRNEGTTGGQLHFRIDSESSLTSPATRSSRANPTCPGGSEGDTLALAFADLDGDGDLEAFEGNGQCGDVLYLNSGDGSFTAQRKEMLTTNAAPTTSMAFADLDGDGDLEAILGSVGGDQVFFNDAAPTLTEISDTPLTQAVQGCSSIALADLDTDGFVDILLGCHGKMVLFQNDGGSDFRAAVSVRDLAVPDQDVHAEDVHAVAVADLDNDGSVDIIAGRDRGGAMLFRNDGGFSFTGFPLNHSLEMEPVYGAGNATNVLAVGDLDGDGRLDLLLGVTGGSDRLFCNEGGFQFSAVYGSLLTADNRSTSALAIADLDGDQRLDILVGHSGGYP
jgi:hypothetical protein